MILFLNLASIFHEKKLKQYVDFTQSQLIEYINVCPHKDTYKFLPTNLCQHTSHIVHCFSFSSTNIECFD